MEGTILSCTHACASFEFKGVADGAVCSGATVDGVIHAGNIVCK